MFRPCRVPWMSHECLLVFDPQDRTSHPYVCVSFLLLSSMGVDISLFCFPLRWDGTTCPPCDLLVTIGIASSSPPPPWRVSSLVSWGCRKGVDVAGGRDLLSCVAPLDLSRSSEGSVLPPFPIAPSDPKEGGKGIRFPRPRTCRDLPSLVTWKRSTWSSGATYDVWRIRNKRDTSQVERKGTNVARRTSTRSKQPWHPTTVDAVHTYRQGNDGEDMRRKKVE